jgi:hypothetical protein
LYVHMNNKKKRKKERKKRTWRLTMRPQLCMFQWLQEARCLGSHGSW